MPSPRGYPLSLFLPKFPPTCERISSPISFLVVTWGPFLGTNL